MHASNSKVPASRIERSTAGTEFQFPDQIPVDAEHTLDQLTGRFRSVRDGLPELIKNAKDQYSRLGVLDRQLRQIVVIAETDSRRLGVIDFAGARSSDFDGWTTWSSRTAGRSELSDDIEAGHGNGGKAFMVRGATEIAFLESCFEGKRTRMGFRNDRPAHRYKPGYAREYGVRLEDVNEPDPKACLETFLDEFGISTAKLPPGALAALQKRRAYTGVLLSRVVEWEGRRKHKVKRLAEMIPDIIASHGQTAMSIETCEVWVIVDGQLAMKTPIEPLALDPYSGFEEPIQHEIPEVLPDPETGDLVDMVGGIEGLRFLRLSTSARQLQISEETKAKNVIRIWNSRNNVANWPLHSLGVLVTSISFIYGEIRCPALTGEHLAGAERIHLSDTPLVRALTEWTRQRVKDLAEDLHRAMMEENRPRDREQAKAALQSLRDLMRQYLDQDAAGDSNDDEELGSGPSGKDGEGKKRKRNPTYFGSRIDEIVLEPGSAKIALAHGTSVPLRFKCIERQPDGSPKSVRATSLRLRCSESGMVSLTSGDRIAATSVGNAEIWLETEDGGISSNRVPCEVVMATDVNIDVPAEILLQGQRIKLSVTFQTLNGPRDDFLIDGAIDEPGMGLLGRHGRFTAGFKEGQATVRVRFGSAPQSQRATVIQVGSERMPPLDGEGSRGSDIPQILLCGEEAPGMEDFPKEQRTLPGGQELPTIIEDPLFPNVIWINPTSKESMRVRGSRGGTSGVGRIASKNFMHFVALKCFDVLKRLHVRQALRGRTVTEFEFIQLAVFAEMECAAFIDAAWELSDDLLGRAEASGAQQAE